VIVRAAPVSHYDWLIARTGLNISRGFRAIEGVDETGRICGMVGYDDWTPNSVQMHTAILFPSVIRSLLRPAFMYPFVEAGRKVIVGITPGDNAAALKLNRHLGLREVYRVKDGWKDGIDVVIQEMRRHECRWINGVDYGR